MKAKKLRPSIFLRAAELQDEQNRKVPNMDNFSCCHIAEANGISVYECHEERFYQNLFGVQEETFTSLLGLRSYRQENIFEIIREANEMRVFALLLAHEVVKDLNAKR